jgi:hypothetical protein
VSISRSLWRPLFLTYQGASTMFLNAFWKRCIILILLCLVHPHSCIPYVRMGFRICLQSVSLLCRDRVALQPGSQYSFLHLRPSSSLFFLTWTFHRRLASGVIPRYFTVSECGIWLSLMVTGMYCVFY